MSGQCFTLQVLGKSGSSMLFSAVIPVGICATKNRPNARKPAVWPCNKNTGKKRGVAGNGRVAGGPPQAQEAPREADDGPAPVTAHGCDALVGPARMRRRSAVAAGGGGGRGIWTLKWRNGLGRRRRGLERQRRLARRRSGGRRALRTRHLVIARCRGALGDNYG